MLKGAHKSISRNPDKHHAELPDSVASPSLSILHICTDRHLSSDTPDTFLLSQTRHIFRLNFLERARCIVKHSQLSISAGGNDPVSLDCKAERQRRRPEAFSRSAFVRSRLTLYSVDGGGTIPALGSERLCRQRWDSLRAETQEHSDHKQRHFLLVLRTLSRSLLG